MDESNQHLFGEGDLADYLSERQQHFLATVKPTTRRIAPAALKARIAKLEAKHHLKAPVIARGLRIVEQGRIADGKPRTEFSLVEPIAPDQFDSNHEFLTARVRYLEALVKHTSPRTYAIIEVSFEGDGDLFRFRPRRCKPPVPHGIVAGSSIRMRIEQSGRHDHGWRAQLKSNLLQLETFLLRTRMEVTAFNDATSKAIRVALTPPPRPPKR